MYGNTTETKIWRVIYPVLLYMLVNMLSQVFFTIIVTMKEFVALGEGNVFSYFSGYNFSGDIERVVGGHTLLVALISGLITIPIALKLMKTDEDRRAYAPVKAHIKNIKLHSWYFIVLVGIMAGMGLGKAVTIFPIDNILGSYEQVQSDFAANSLLWQILALVLVGPCTEELIFRGLVYKRIKGYTESMWSVYISAAAFGIYHFNLVQGLYGFVLGILLCYVYEKYKTIAAPIIMHMAANLAALVLQYSDIAHAIADNIYLKILFMLLELGILTALLWRMNSIDDINLKNHRLIELHKAKGKDSEK